MRPYVVYVTAGSSKEAQTIARALVAERLAACVSIVPGIQSIYRWKGRVEKSREWLLIIKTTAKRFKALSQRVQELHSYEVPEILAIPIAAGNSAYLKWLNDSVGQKVEAS